MTEAVDRLRLLQFVLIQALFLTGCSSESDRNVECQKITGTVGKPLTLTCNIVGDQSCSCTQYKWKKNGIELKNGTGTDCKGKCTLNYTIQNPSMTDSGTFTLWVQLTSGCNEGHFSVILSEEVIPAAPEEVIPAAPENVTLAPQGSGAKAPQEKTEQPDDKSARNHQVVVIFAALLTILGLTYLAIFCRNHRTTISQRLNFDLFRKQSTSQGMV
ncbi:uncharacterized protein LOC108415544 isoform X2 [Pygocentrus nattereri]|uniref:uncharacterized protein LOC108415544 isoform X2 n=1 Tax=Pygocentrus nattereri TaxID=42514 RepID=UPI0008148BBE|nr:uncharacterized protein LOC108415544 isoform X2 [Pygocentrus nattereri]